ncbi:hypothetical protein GF319_14025 [Candidatus Bathyarchaeota archaeon]|nr:hypothetical protein [Candidatus Bathyarchaeota archaeon]
MAQNDTIEEETRSDIIEDLRGIMDCLIKGKWGLTEVKDIPLSGEWSKLINNVPIAVNVCVDHDCALKIKKNLWNVSPLTPDIIRNRRINFSEFGREVNEVLGKQALTAVAGVVGLRTNEAAALIGSIALYIAVNSTIIATQIELFEDGNGVCFHKGPLPWPFPIKMGPFLLDIPVIVTQRSLEEAPVVEPPETIEE